MKSKMVATEAGLQEIKVGRSFVRLEEYDKNFYKIIHNFSYGRNGEIQKTKDYAKIVNNLISLTKFTRNKIERSIATGYLKVRNNISNETLNYIGNFLSEWYVDNKTIYQNIEKIEKIEKIEHIFIKRDLTIDYYAVEYNKTKHRLYNYGRKHLFINGFTPVDDFIDIIDDVYQNAILLALELNKNFEDIFYKLFKREMKFLKKSERRVKYLSELIEKEEHTQEELQENGYIEDLNDGLTD